MRRFSQRSYLVTLSEINVTPLLDLAFVLLIIFVITTPLLEQSINLHLPHGGRQELKHNLATICERYGGGGHARVGAISLAPGALDQARTVAAEIVAELQN